MILKLYRRAAQQFRSFTDKNEMNEHVSAHIFAAGRKLHKNARSILNMIAHHSCIITGVSWLNDETIADNLGVCPRTVTRAIDRLIMLGIGRREVVYHDGIMLRYFVLHRFELSPYCPDIDSGLSSVESGTSPTAPKDEGTLPAAETLETKELVNNNVVVEYPSAIIETLSRHDLTVNAATLKRWFSLATEEVIVHVIECALNRNGVRNVIAWITGVLQQGYVKERTVTYNPSVTTKRRQSVRSDELPDYVQRQIERQNEVQTVGELSEDKKRIVAELLAALGE